MDPSEDARSVLQRFRRRSEPLEDPPKPADVGEEELADVSVARISPFPLCLPAAHRFTSVPSASMIPFVRIARLQDTHVTLRGLRVRKRSRPAAGQVAIAPNSTA